MFKPLAMGLVAIALTGCASLLDGRDSAAAEPVAAQAEIRAGLERLRQQPELASDELIRDLEAFLREREQRRQVLLAAERQAAQEAAERRAAFDAAERRAALEAARRRAELEAFDRKPAPAPRVAPASRPAAPVAPTVVVVAPKPVAPAPAQVAVVLPSPAAPVAISTLSDAESLFERGRTLEGERRVAQAMPLYSTASRQGLAAATVRLMEIYAAGAEGVSRDYLAAVRYKDLAVQQGVRLEYPPRR